MLSSSVGFLLEGSRPLDGNRGLETEPETDSLQHHRHRDRERQPTPSQTQSRDGQPAPSQTQRQGRTACTVTDTETGTDSPHCHRNSPFSVGTAREAKPVYFRSWKSVPTGFSQIIFDPFVLKSFNLQRCSNLK